MIVQRTGSQEPKLIIGAAALCVLAFVVFQKISVYLARRRFKKEHGCQPIKTKYPFKDPVLGLDVMFENIRNGKNKKFLEGIYKRNLKYGPTFQGNLTGTPIILTIDPENIKTVLSLRFKDYSLGNRRPMQTLFGLGIFTTDGERWANSRHMIRPNFARDQVADLTAFERHDQDMFKLIPRDGSTVDLQDLFFRLTIDSATEFLFGESVNCLKNNDAEFAGAFNYAQHEMALSFRLGFFSRFRRNKQAQESTRICHEFVDKFVDDAVRYRETHDLEKQPKEDKYVFLHELAKFTGDKRRLRDELLNVLLAGRDTTASLLSNMFFELAKRPDIFAKLRAEVEELNGRVPTYEQLRNMKYVKWCMNECEYLPYTFFYLASAPLLHVLHI
jgi:cytochrome P450